MEKVTGILFLILIAGVSTQAPPVDWTNTTSWAG